MRGHLRPDTGDLSLAIDPTLVHPPEIFRAVYVLYRHLGTQCVWTYSEPTDDPKIRDDEQELRRIVWMDIRRLRRLRPKIEAYFVIEDGYWRARYPEWIRIATPSRVPLKETTREVARMRSDERCAYCGDEEGPFHFDHLYPRARGGSDDDHNIVLACVPCNRSKRDKTLMEWVASLLPEERAP